MPRTFVHRLDAAGPDDADVLLRAIDEGRIDPASIVAILGKTEGNGCVNDFTRGFATRTLAAALADRLGLKEAEVEARVALVMSGGTEGGLSPHWLVFEVRQDYIPATRPKALAAGVAFTRDLLPEELGRQAQITTTADAVRAAMKAAGISDPTDVHYVQVKCPLLTKARIADAASRGATVATPDTLASMGRSRGASALGVAVALGEITLAQATDAAVCSDRALYSKVASCSAGIELVRNEIMVLGNAPGWAGDLVIGHDVMADAIDADAARRALGSLSPDRMVAVLTKAEASVSGQIRGARHTMLDDSDISSTRHARALVGGVLAGVFGDTRLFVSGGAEHQGPDGGGPLAVIARA